jgi:hypothetical protein
MTLSHRAMAIIVGGLLGLVALNPIVHDSSTVAAFETVVEPTASPSPTSVPTLIIGARPLSIEQAASVTSAVAGDEFIYSLLISSSSANVRTIRVQARLDAQIEMIGIIVSDGSCRDGNPLVCDVRAHRDQPATIVIGVRVRPEAQTGTRIVGQSLAQDDEYNTASTDQVFVDIVMPGRLSPDSVATPTLVPPPPEVNAQAPMPTAESIPPSTPDSGPVVSAQQPSPTEEEVEEADEEVEQDDEEQAATLTSTSVPTATVEAATLTPTPVPTATVETDTPTSAPTLVPPTNTAPAVLLATARPAQPRPTAAPSPAPEATRPSAPLPNTATTTPAVGGAVALLGLALVVRGARRVRRAGARLAEQGAVTTQLGPLLRVIAARQRAAATNIAKMERQSRQLADRLNQTSAEEERSADE